LVGDLPITADSPHTHLPHSLLPGLTFPDLVNAADAVIAKPGYGIASECVLHHTPMIAIERPDFRETPVLMQQLANLGPCAHMPLNDFFAGNWASYTERVLTDDTPWTSIPVNGAEKIALKLGEVFSLS
jgi:L-arabinokinase